MARRLVAPEEALRVAYRKLLTLAFFTLGGAVLGCGSGGAAHAPPYEGDQPAATSSDQAPSNPDQPPRNADQPPYSPDQAGGTTSPGSGAGDEAAAEAACRALCDDVGTTQDDCPGGGANALARALCGKGCRVTAEVKPCLTKAVELVNCLAELGELCTQEGPSESDAARCAAIADQLDECVDPEQPNPQPGGGSCSLDDRCVSCANDCESCKCVLGADDATCDLVCN